MPSYQRFNDESENYVEATETSAASSPTEAPSATALSTPPASSDEKAAVSIFISYKESNELEAADNVMTEIPQEPLAEDGR